MNTNHDMAHTDAPPETPPPPETTTPETTTPADRRRRRKSRSAAAERVYYSAETAGPMLDMTPQSLRARAQRAARRQGNRIVAHIGPGVIATKFGRTWRFRIDGDALNTRDVD